MKGSIVESPGMEKDVKDAVEDKEAQKLENKHLRKQLKAKKTKNAKLAKELAERN